MSRVFNGVLQGILLSLLVAANAYSAPVSMSRDGEHRRAADADRVKVTERARPSRVSQKESDSGLPAVKKNTPHLVNTSPKIAQPLPSYAPGDDTDGDGILDEFDLDDDGDGVQDIFDDYPEGRFDDVRPGYWAFSQIEALARSGITAGCTASSYCPSEQVTRAQMAVFLERAMRGSGFVPPPATGIVFQDVPGSYWAARFIEQLAADGITTGCSVGYFCPDDGVTRAQMAVFLLRATHGAGYTPPVATGTLFGDVPGSYWAVNWIEQLAAEGITLGCGSGNYCPEAIVPRDQMGVFLVRAFNLMNPVSVTLSGTITFDLVPRDPVTGGLDYAGTVTMPAGSIRVQAISSADNTTVLATAETDDSGAYSMTVDPKTGMFLRARAQMIRTGTPAWDVSVVDNNGVRNSGVPKPVYVLDSAVFDSGISDPGLDLHAASGWVTDSYSEPRAAAPFSILHAVKQAGMLVVDADPNAIFPPLFINWSPNNTVAGPVGTSFWDGQEIYLLGDADNDTEEFDHSVIVHEFGHYIESMFSRSDSIGGPHSLGDLLDPRVAFGEGFGNAFQAMARGDSVYFDTGGPGQAFGFSFDVEDNCETQDRGWFNECSVQSLLYDLFDEANNAESSGDDISLGFGPIYDVLSASQPNVQSLTTIHPFGTFLRGLIAGSESGLDGLLAYHGIVSGVSLDIWADNELNEPPPDRNVNLDASVDIIPIYKTGLVADSSAIELCVDVDSSEGYYNKLGNRQFIRFTVPSSGSYQITATSSSSPGISTPDPDMVLYDKGAINFAFDSAATSETFCGGPNDFGPCPGGYLQLTAGTQYVLELQDDNNLSYGLDPDHIGLYCATVALTSVP